MASAAGALAHSAGAAITSADFSEAPLSAAYSGSSRISIDFDSVSASNDSLANVDAELYFSGGNEIPSVTTSGNWRVSVGSYANKFSFGDAITLSGAPLADMETDNDGTWHSSRWVGRHGISWFF